MCYCVEEIKIGIAAVQTESGNNIKKVIANMDDFLDFVLELTKDFKGLRGQIDAVWTLLHDNFQSLRNEDIHQFGDDLKDTIDRLNKLYVLARGSRFYGGCKSELLRLRDSIDNLKEMYNDLSIYKLKLPENENYKSIVSQLNLI